MAKHFADRKALEQELGALKVNTTMHDSEMQDQLDNLKKKASELLGRALDTSRQRSGRPDEEALALYRALEKNIREALKSVTLKINEPQKTALLNKKDDILASSDPYKIKLEALEQLKRDAEDIERNVRNKTGDIFGSDEQAVAPYEKLVKDIQERIYSLSRQEYSAQDVRKKEVQETESQYKKALKDQLNDKMPQESYNILYAQVGNKTGTLYDEYNAIFAEPDSEEKIKKLEKLNAKVDIIDGEVRELRNYYTRTYNNIPNTYHLKQSIWHSITQTKLNVLVPVLEKLQNRYAELQPGLQSTDAYRQKIIRWTSLEQEVKALESAIFEITQHVTDRDYTIPKAKDLLNAINKDLNQFKLNVQAEKLNDLEQRYNRIKSQDDTEQKIAQLEKNKAELDEIKSAISSVTRYFATTNAEKQYTIPDTDTLEKRITKDLKQTKINVFGAQLEQKKKEYDAAEAALKKQIEDAAKPIKKKLTESYYSFDKTIDCKTFDEWRDKIKTGDAEKLILPPLDWPMFTW